MSVTWFTGKPGHVAQHQGTAGTFIVLADVSSSMDCQRETLRIALQRVLMTYPGSRAFVFACHIAEITAHHFPDVGGSTNLNAALCAVAPFRPGKTVVISDGCVHDVTASLETAARMTGSIDALWCKDPETVLELGRDFMEELARAGRGASQPLLLNRGPEALFRDLSARAPSQPHFQRIGEAPMRRPIPGGRVDVRASPDQAQVIYEDLHFFRQRRIHTHYLPDEHIEHGEAENVQLDMAPTQVNVQHAEQPIVGRHESSHGWLTSFIDRMVNARPAAVQNRGELRALPQGSAAPALPSPQMRPAPASVMQIAHQPAPQFDAQRERSAWAKAILGD
jgi:hypothetical protein